MKLMRNLDASSEQSVRNFLKDASMEPNPVQNGVQRYGQY